MPTPVSVARQCLSEEAARALDDAVAVARRRSHAQTSSLHAVSALLALPSSTLRDACARARNSPCPSRLQFRALELCVGVSLDRLPSSKTLEDDPPISNSLMAAIKRSQANQRRHPDHFHLHQIHCNQQAASVLKVELKHFILSILDDPIVSRVLGDAGFRSCDIKLAIIHPPVSQQSLKFSRSRCPPPIFLCNLTASDPDRLGFGGYPFSGHVGGGGCDGDPDENCRRIGEMISKAKSLLLVGVCATDALSKFIERINSDENKGGILSSEIAGLRAVSVDKEIVEFVSELGLDKGEEKMGSKFDELRNILEQCSSRGILLNLGELKVFADENACNGDAVSYLVEKLTGLMVDFREKLWLIGSAARYETYPKFLGKFPSIEKDWDLRLLPITSKSHIGSFASKSSLMGSFVPFGGFFSTPSDFKNPLHNINETVTRCHLCTAKFEQEVSAMLRTGSTISVADQCSDNLPSWLQMAERETAKGMDVPETKNDGATLNAKISGLQKKWNDICQRLHHAQPFSKFDISKDSTLVSIPEGSPYVPDREESSCSRDSALYQSHCATLGLGIHMDLQNVFPAKHSMPIPVASEVNNNSCNPKLYSQQNAKDSPRLPFPNTRMRADDTSTSSVTFVTTDLGLGTIYASSSQEPNILKLCDRKEYLQRFSGFRSSEFGINESTSQQMIRSSFSNPSLGGHFDCGDYKLIMKALADKVGRQEGAICAISRAISRCKAGSGRRYGSTSRGDIWLSFLGPDEVGKRRIASTLAEIMFGSHEHLITVNLRLHDGGSSSNSVFECEKSNDYDMKFRGKTIVDYMSMELSKRPRSVILLENVDKADFLVQNSLSQAVRAGKFPDSHGREISINNMIFLITSSIPMGNTNYMPQKEPMKFSEESVLRAKSWQMKLLMENAAEGSNRSNLQLSRTVAPSASPVNKRKLDYNTDSGEQDFSKEAKKRGHKGFGSSLDLNLPVEETEEDTESVGCDSDSISENSQAWLEEFFDQVDEKVLFRPFDFDALAANITREISIHFERVFGSEIRLEVNDEVMVQILAASWLSDRARAMEEWVGEVLGRGFLEARQKYEFRVENVVKLVPCKGVVVEERASGICLPARINV